MNTRYTRCKASPSEANEGEAQSMTFICGLKRNKYQPSNVHNTNNHNLYLNFEDVLNLPNNCTLLNESIIKNIMIQKIKIAIHNQQ